MGLKDVRIKAIKCLENGDIMHSERNHDSIDDKNLLACNKVQPDYVIMLLRKTTGLEYEESEHHYLETVSVHVCKPIWEGKRWYVKFHFEEANIVFLSVHLSL
ncbi:MAG: hypothetical protein H9855_00060 [Candidatus Acinetobacter avistercoris]|nr:hypothetical protein [Candidatus Acinetobacter avistercoris]